MLDMLTVNFILQSKPVSPNNSKNTMQIYTFPFTYYKRAYCQNDLIILQSIFVILQAMNALKIGIIKEGKVPSDKRVPLSPKQCQILKVTYPDLKLVVQSSEVRCFEDHEYSNLGVTIVDDVSDCDVLMGIKEVPKNELIANKTYFYFSHTIKEQPYNRALLQKMLSLNINMVDYEVLTHSHGGRIIGFGRYAGVVGCYNGFLAYGKRNNSYKLKSAHECFDRKELEKELKKVELPNIKIILTGKGRVGHGALEILQVLKIREVNKEDFISKQFDEPVFVHLDFYDYYQTKDGSKFNSSIFFKNPQSFESCFMNFAKHADMFIAGHYYGAESPYLFTREDAQHEDFKIRTVADISCDIDGPVACTIRPSTISDPIYGYNVKTQKEDVFNHPDVITVMAVDNLPCELPKDASEDFGNELIKHILPCLLNHDTDNVIERATICKEGSLNGLFTYLQDYVEGN